MRQIITTIKYVTRYKKKQTGDTSKVSISMLFEIF